MVPKSCRYLIVLINLVWISVSASEKKNSTANLDNHIDNNSTFGGFVPTKPDSDFFQQHNFTDINISNNTLSKRLFPIGTPDLIPQSSNLVSPFDPATFSQQLLPLISAGVKEKVKSFARDIHHKVGALEYALNEEWKQSPFNPHNFDTLREIFNPYKLLFHPPLLPTAALFKNHPAVYKIPPAQYKPGNYVETFVKGKYPKSLYKNQKPENEQPVNVVMKELGISSYRHFEDQILRDIEKREEQKVEATLHTLYDDESEVVEGKPYHLGPGWKPVAEPTKTYDTNSVHSQIVSPLHTSFVGTGIGNHATVIKNHHLNQQNTIQYGIDHDQDPLSYHNPFKTHRPYEIHEDTGESKLKPIHTHFDDPPVTTHKPRYTVPTKSTKSTKVTKKPNRFQQRKKQKDKANLDNVAIPDIKPIESNALPTVHKPREFIPRHHIQSLTTARPKSTTENYSFDSAETRLHPVRFSAEFKHPKRHFVPKIQRAASTHSQTIVRGTTTTTTPKPSKNVPRSANTGKFVDVPKVTGRRGSVKFMDHLKKQPLN